MTMNWWIFRFQTVFKIPSCCLVCFVGSLYHFFLLPRVSGSVFVSVFANEKTFNHIAIRKSKCVAFKGYLRLLTKSWDTSRLKRYRIPLIYLYYTIVVPLCIQEFWTSLVQLQFHHTFCRNTTRAAAILAVLMGLAVAPYRCSSEICFVDVAAWLSVNMAGKSSGGDLYFKWINGGFDRKII